MSGGAGEADGGYALEAVHQRGDRRGWRILDQQMHVVVLAIARPKLGAKIGADFGKDGSDFLDGRAIEYMSTIFCHKDQVDMKHENAGSAATNVTCNAHRPNYIITI
jgi:hypothetical protein